MKIKFIKDYVSVDPATNSGIIHGFGETEEIEDYTAQWLIDNGFAKKVEEPGWESWKNCDYYYVRDYMSMISTTGYEYIGCQHWTNSEDTLYRYSIGNVFKTRESAQRFINYLKAVETVRHDEGFMKISRKIDHAPYGYAIVHSHWSESLVAEHVDSANYAGKFYFDTSDHAQASLNKHRDEWRTILNYDWSKGEDEEEDDEN